MPKEKLDNPTRMTVVLPKADYDALKKLAATRMRSASAQVAYLIKKELLAAQALGDIP